MSDQQESFDFDEPSVGPWSALYEPPFYGEMSLARARKLLTERVDEGVGCPCCTQFAKVYRRKVNSSMARGLIAAWREYGRGFGYLQDVRRKSGETDNREESKLRYWGLMEEEPKLRPDGGRAGWWRVTDRGYEWIMGWSVVPKYAHLYDGQFLRFSGDPVTIRDALGTKFDYGELMEGV